MKSAAQKTWRLDHARDLDSGWPDFLDAALRDAAFVRDLDLLVARHGDDARFALLIDRARWDTLGACSVVAVASQTGNCSDVPDEIVEALRDWAQKRGINCITGVFTEGLAPLWQRVGDVRTSTHFIAQLRRAS